MDESKEEGSGSGRLGGCEVWGGRKDFTKRRHFLKEAEEVRKEFFALLERSLPGKGES